MRSPGSCGWSNACSPKVCSNDPITDAEVAAAEKVFLPIPPNFLGSFEHVDVFSDDSGSSTSVGSLLIMRYHCAGDQRTQSSLSSIGCWCSVVGKQ